MAHEGNPTAILSHGQQLQQSVSDLGSHRHEREWHDYLRRSLYIARDCPQPGDGHSDSHIGGSNNAGIGHCQPPDPDWQRVVTGAVHRYRNSERGRDIALADGIADRGLRDVVAVG